MARVGNTNNTFTTIGGILYAYKQLKKSVGYTVPKSSDGLTYSGSGDIITTPNSGAGGFQNAKAYCVLRDPLGRREELLQNVIIGTLNGSATWRQKVSELARFIGGSPSATVTPSAGDEIVLAGTGTDAAPVGINWGGTGTSRLQMVVETVPIGGVYAYQVNSFNPGLSTQANGQMFCEPLAPGSYDPADASPCVWFASSTVFAGAGAQGWIAYGLGAQTLATNISLNAGIFNGGLGQDPVNNKDVNGFQQWSYVLAATTRPRGYSTCIGVKGPARPYPATTNRASASAFYYAGNYAWMYPTNTDPVP